MRPLPQLMRLSFLKGVGKNVPFLSIAIDSHFPIFKVIKFYPVKFLSLKLF